MPFGYRKYLLCVLLLVLAFNNVDRLALGLVLQEIKTDLSLSDSQLGLLTGLAFAFFYSIMGIPIARWADRGNRVAIIAITTGLWSAAVALCGAAGSFVQLLLIRVGVAVGEAGCIPPAHSLMADTFERAERPRAASTYMLGFPLSTVIGYLLAGWLNEVVGWRMMFMLLGLPGLALALLAYFTLREPRRVKSAASAEIRLGRVSKPEQADQTALTSTQPTLKEVATALWAITAFRHLLCCWSVFSFFGYGIVQWQPAFFIRSYGLQTGELGAWFALIWGGGGLLGTYLGGEWASRYAANNERLQLRVMAWMIAGFGVISALVYLSPDAYLAFGMLGIAIVAGSMVNGPLFSTIQTLVPERMRATSIAIVYLCANLIGMGLGPLAAGIMSDAFRPWAGHESLRYALLALSPGYFWSAWHLWMGSKTIKGDIELVRVDPGCEADEAYGPTHQAVKPSSA